MYWLIQNPRIIWHKMLMMKRWTSIPGLQFRFLVDYLLPLSLPRRRKLATTSLISTIDLGALIVSLAAATILLITLPNPVDATFLYFVLTTVFSEMSLTSTMYHVWSVDSTHRKLSLPQSVIRKALTIQWSSAYRTSSRTAVCRRWFTKLTKNQLFGQPLKKLSDELVDQEFSNPLRQFLNCLLLVNLHPMARPKGQCRLSRINSGP